MKETHVTLLFWMIFYINFVRTDNCNVVIYNSWYFIIIGYR